MSKWSQVCALICDNLLFSLQTYKLFEKLADQDREQQLSELQKREESRCVPPAVQELEITAEPPEGTEEQSAGAAKTESSSLDAGDSSAETAVSPQSDSSSSAPVQVPQEDQASAASAHSEE